MKRCDESKLEQDDHRACLVQFDSSADKRPSSPAFPPLPPHPCPLLFSLPPVNPSAARTRCEDFFPRLAQRPDWGRLQPPVLSLYTITQVIVPQKLSSPSVKLCFARFRPPPLGIPSAWAFRSRTYLVMATSVTPKASSATSGLKRKRESSAKFYAVRLGHKPGIYHTWPDCLAQVKGFKGATCESGLSP